MSQTQRIAVYSISDLKNTTDDALAPYLKGRKKFTQNHLLTDVRLSLGYAAVAIAAITFYLDYISTWEKTKAWTLWAVISYFVINGALTLWIWGVEKGKVFAGSRRGLLISFASHVNKHEPVYRLRVIYSDANDAANTKSRTIGAEAPFTRWFTADGQLIADQLHKWLESAVPVLSER